MPGDDDKYVPFTLPDVTKVNASLIRKFSTAPNIPVWRTLGFGLNLEGICKNKKEKCAAQGKRVWVNLGYGEFHMSEQVYQAKCPMCKKPTKGNKLIGLYEAEMTGRGMRYKKNSKNDDDTDDDQKSTQNTEAGAQENVQQENANADEEMEEEFPKLICNTKDGFLYMNGLNGPLVQWRYMVLNIKKLEQKQDKK